MNVELWIYHSNGKVRNSGKRAQYMWKWLDEWSMTADADECKRQRSEGFSDGRMDIHHERKRRIDYMFMTIRWDLIGVAKEWHCRSDHRPLLAELPRRDGEVIRFAPPRASAMLG